MGTVLAFPLVKRMGFIHRQVNYMGQMNATARARHLERQVEIQRRALLSKHIHASIVEAELAQFRAVINARLAIVILRSGGVA
jgi:hypothetical protein